MFSNIGRCVVAALLVGLSAAGCTVNGPDVSPAGTPTSGQAAPDRPSDLSLAGKRNEDMCSLITAAQLQQLGLEGGQPNTDDSPGTTAGCSFPTPPGVQPAFAINLYARQIPIDQFKSETGTPFPETAATYDISGFRAEQRQSGAGLEQMGCSVGIDIADGQTLEAFTAPVLAGSLSNQDMCAKAKQAAELALGSLQAQG